jgi:glycogen phosphorylase
VLGEFLHEPRVAYFSMEIALESEIPTYAGGLGILAGDTLRSAADLALPLVGVSLVSRAGYFRQEIDAGGRQIEHAATWDPSRLARRLDAKIAIRIEGRAVWIGAWLYVLQSHLGGRAPTILLDTDLEENQPEDRELTHYLYGGDDAYRLKQEMVLGIGGVRLLHALGFDINAYHLNEGHSALLGIELLRQHAYPPEDLRPGDSQYDIPRVRELCRFTTHTPVDAGHDRFSYELLQRLFADGAGAAQQFVDLATLKNLAGAEHLNMTRLALNLSEFVNGVARRHAEVSRLMFPGYQVRAITNGVHPFTWTADSFRELYNRYVPGWCHEPEFLMRAYSVPDAAIAEAHAAAKGQLIDRVRALTGVELRPKVATLGFARRMTAYKRPDLLFSDLERLRGIARERALQIVIAGKAHPHDEEGKRLIALLHERARAIGDTITTVYLPDYDMALARTLVAGVDVWLNTPLPPQEASGTSGMKAAFNGVPSLSVLDGWWIEGCIEGLTGWAIGDGHGTADGDDSRSLYDKLEHVVLPLYYGTSAEPGGWAKVMKGAICLNGSYFNSHRMMRRYATEAYLR